MTDYRRLLDELIQGVLDERLSMEQFQRQYSQCFIEKMPDDALTPRELEQYGAVHEKAEWTTRNPPTEDRAVGWMDASGFRDWLQAHRPTPQS
jgi:hypothetical protein